MNFLKKISFLALGAVIFSAFMLENKVQAVSYYGLSCTNLSYGTQNSNGFTYLQSYHDNTAGQGGLGTDEVLGDSGGIKHYLGRDCLYSGAGLTNSAAIVSGDVARNAVNSIVSAVTSRMNVAMAQNANTAAHMSYSANEYGIGMAANRVIGGLSIWTNYSDSDFENDQTFTNNRVDSNNYDGSSSNFTFGIDKKFGNILIGVTGSSFDTDIDVSANSGRYEADGETYGIYAGISTGVLNVTVGGGVGEYDVETERLDLGTGNTTITGSATADVQYMHLSANATLSRGKVIIMPRLAYRSLDLETPAFTDVVPNDANIAGPTNNNTTGTLASGRNTADVSVAAFDASSEMTEVGAMLSFDLGRAITPYVDAAYVMEDTTGAAYKLELTTDDVTEVAATDADGYTLLGIGVNLSLRGKLSGNIAYYEVYDRDDYQETNISGTLRLNF